MHLPFVLETTKAIFRNAIHRGLPGEQREGKLKPLKALLLFYQKLEDKLTEYGKTVRRSTKKKRRQKVDENENRRKGLK